MENNSGPAIVAPEAAPSTPDAAPAIAGGLVISPPAPEGEAPAPDATGSQTEPMAAGTSAENPGVATPDTAPAAPAGFAAKYGKTLESVLPPVPGNELAAPAAQSVQARRGISAADLLQMADAAASPAPGDSATGPEAAATDAPLQVDSASGLPQTEPPAPDAAHAPSDQSTADNPAPTDTLGTPADQAPNNSDSGQAPTTELQADNPFSTPTTEPQSPADTGADTQPVTDDLGAPAPDTTPSDTAPAGTIAGDSPADIASLNTDATGESTQIPSAAPAESSTNDPKFDALVQKIAAKQNTASQPSAEATASGTAPDAAAQDTNAADTTPAENNPVDTPEAALSDTKTGEIIREIKGLQQQGVEAYDTVIAQRQEAYTQASTKAQEAIGEIKGGLSGNIDMINNLGQMDMALKEALSAAGDTLALELRKSMLLRGDYSPIPIDNPNVALLAPFVKARYEAEGKPKPTYITFEDLKEYTEAFSNKPEQRSALEQMNDRVQGNQKWDALTGTRAA